MTTAGGYPGQTLLDLKDPALGSFIDMARWMAAFMVMVGHLRNPLLLGYGDRPAADQTLAVKLWFFATGFHAEAVLVFFVLSGFLVGGMSVARMARGQYHGWSYVIDRVSRLFIAFVPALLLTVLLDLAGAHWFGGSGIYDGTHPMIVQKVHGIAFADTLTLPVFFTNLFMLQTYFGPELGSNQPLWTLSTEFWFYMVFAVAAAAALASGPKRIVFAAMAITMSAVLGVDFILWMGLWLIGLGLAFVHSPRLSRPLLATAALGAWLAMLRVMDGWFDAHLSAKTAAHYVMALLFAWLILSMRGRKVALFVALARFNKVMADFSFSLYLIHFPLIMFAIAALGTLTGNPGFYAGFPATDPVGIATYVGLIVLILLVSWAFSRATEAHTARLRQALKRRFL